MQISNGTAERATSDATAPPPRRPALTPQRLQTMTALRTARAEQVRLVLKNEVLHDESMTLGGRGVESGSQVNAVSQ